MTIVKTRRLGGSLIVTLPKSLVEQEGLTEDQLVEIEVRRPLPSGFGMAKGIGSFTAEDKFIGQLE